MLEMTSEFYVSLHPRLQAQAKLHLAPFIREVPDFPKPGILFKDITPLLANGPAFQRSIELLSDLSHHLEPEAFVACEARGFFFGAALAQHKKLGIHPVRKPGKLPGAVLSKAYTLEYGTDILEMSKDPTLAGKRVVIVDDLLATGGTVKATIDLVERQGGIVAGLIFLIELEVLHGRSKLAGYNVHSLLLY